MGIWIVLMYVTVFLHFSKNIVTDSADEDFFKNFLIEEPVDEAQCDQIQSDVAERDSATMIDDVPNLNGKWVSQECEIRPGPEFLLRIYSFTKNNTFRLIQHFYEDEFCFLPLYTIRARGRLVLQKPSWITPSGTESQFILTRVTFTSHTTGTTSKLWEEIRSNCSELGYKSWKPHREYIIYDQKKKKAPLDYHHISEMFGPKSERTKNECLSNMGLEFNELKLIRTQWRPVDEYKKNREMLLGDIYSLKELRFSYTPTAFQVPLLKIGHAHGCVNCRLIAKGNGRTLPHLLSKPMLPPLPHGQWVSQRCEVRPLGMFLKRRFSFNSRDRTWMGEYKFFADPFCAESTLSISASGKYVLGPFHNKEKLFRKRKVGTNFDLDVQEAFLTLYDFTLRDTFNAEPNCGIGTWYVGIPKDLSPTSGCSILGIVLPVVEQELIKLDIDSRGTPLLLMGSPYNERKQWPNERPTSYQAPLIQCSVLPKQNLFSNHQKPACLGRRALRSSCPKKMSNFSYACVIILFISCLVSN